MPTITTRGNITATSYGFGSAGGAALDGSYFLAKLRSSGGNDLVVFSISNTTTSSLLFTASSSTDLQQIIGSLSKTGTLSWAKKFGSSFNVADCGVGATDGSGTAYTWLVRNRTGGDKYSESTGALTAGRYAYTGAYFLNSAECAALVPSGSSTYIHAVGRCYDSTRNYMGFGAAVLPNTGTMPSQNWYSTTSTYFTGLGAKVTPVTSTTSYGVCAGSTGSTDNSAVYTRIAFNGTNTPVGVTKYFYNSNPSYTYSTDGFLGAVVDTSGDVYAVGNMAYNGSTMEFLAFFVRSGSTNWVRRVGSTNGGLGDAALDSNGNVYFAYMDSNGTSAKIVKYTTSGTFVWCRSLGTVASSSSGPVKITTDTYSFWVTLRNYTGETVILRAPLDGSKTGTYGGYTYAVAETSDSAFTNYSSADITLTSDSPANAPTTGTGTTITANTPVVTTTTIT